MKKILGMLAVLLIVSGCGSNVFQGVENKNSTEATAMDVSLKLDSGDYQWILDNPDKVNATDYAAAAMGKAGLDPTNLMQALNDIASGSSTSQNDLSAVTSLAIDPSALSYLQDAMSKLQTELDANPTDPDLNFQMTLTSLTSAVTAMAQVGQNNAVTYTDSNGNTQTFDATNGISTEEAEALGSYIVSDPSVQVDTTGDGSLDTSLVTLVATDVTTVIDTLPNANLGTDSDLNTVLTDVTQGTGSLNYDGSGSVSATDISSYLTVVLGQ